MPGVGRVVWPPRQQSMLMNRHQQEYVHLVCTVGESLEFSTHRMSTDTQSAGTRFPAVGTWVYDSRSTTLLACWASSGPYQIAFETSIDGNLHSASLETYVDSPVSTATSATATPKSRPTPTIQIVRPNQTKHQAQTRRM
jgi:hypothetical protein